MSSSDLSKNPATDGAEFNSYFPSPYSLSVYTGPKTDFDNADYDKYTGKWKVLLIGSQERYLEMGNGKNFSTGNHPVELLLPLLHLDAAGFDVDIVTPSGDPVKLEVWAFPKEDKAIQAIFDKYKEKLRNPGDIRDYLTPEALENYLAVFIPGGHGVMNDIPQSRDVGKVLKYINEKDRFVISLCHGPAGLLAENVGDKPEDFFWKGYEIVVFPDSLDTGANQDIGYIPGPMPWLVGESLKKKGVKILNSDITGKVHQDRRLLTGDSPLASNQLGHLAADVLLKAVKTEEKFKR